MFMDKDHEQYYNKFLKLDNAYIGDNERKALFYLLSFNEETRNHINDIYDFQKHQIKFEGLEQGWQTSGSFAVTKLAFNLYNGFNGEYSLEGADEPRRANMTPLDVVCHFRGEELEILFNAIKIRLGEYAI